MGCELPIEGEGTLRWTRAQTAFNAWRGRCLHSFTGVEAEVSEALLRLTASHASPIYPHLAGERCATVMSAAQTLGACADPPLVLAFTAFQRHGELRTALCHGKATITLDRADRWTAVLRLTTFRNRTFDRVVTVVEETESEAIARDLTRDGQRLIQRLRGWCAEAHG